MYKYKIQWLFSYLDAKNILPIIWPKSLDYIRARNESLWDKYDSMCMHSPQEALDKAQEWIDKMRDEWYGTFEFIRR